jgi:DNA mismatch repair protein MutL
MLSVEWQALDLRVHGFVSRPTIARSRRSGQYVFVNRRPIQPGLLAVMLERPYAGRLPPGRHPLAVVHLTVDPHYIDVNVHPRKAEIRFAHERTIYNAMVSAVSGALQEYPRSMDGDDVIWPFGHWVGNALTPLNEAPTSYDTSSLRVLAQLHGTYILAQTPDGMLIADQHAAHEQVLFEQLHQGSEQTTLSPPARIDLTPREVDILDRIAPLLNDLGIETEPFGSRVFLVRRLPALLQSQDPAVLLTELLQEGDRCRGSADEQRDQLAMKAACLSAVKAGDPMTNEQMQRLLDDLAQTWSPATCPHGRPAVVSVSMEELAQRFGR